MTPREIRKIILDQSMRAKVGHIGCALSVADIIACLYGGVLRIDDPAAADRDRFILSKGHAALALYAVLFLRGWLTRDELDSFHTDGSRLGVHPEHVVKGIDFSSGSLGQGLSIGAGAALAARRQKSARRVFVLLSDAECNEGSTWEAVMFAAHHRLSNLTAVIDLNGQQALGYTKEVLDLPDMAKRWEAFGWEVIVADGHDLEALRAALGRPVVGPAPRVIIARTVFARGVSFMESRIEWHYLPMTADQYQRALAEIS